MRATFGRFFIETTHFDFQTGRIFSAKYIGGNQKLFNKYKYKNCSKTNVFTQNLNFKIDSQLIFKISIYILCP